MSRIFINSLDSTALKQYIIIPMSKNQNNLILIFYRVCTFLAIGLVLYGCSCSTEPVRQERPISTTVRITPFDKTTQALFKAPTEEERRLHLLLNAYRNKWGLPSVRLSKSLCHVAQAHVNDLHHYPPRPPCNVHSWSVHGPWRPVCYSDNHDGAERMWSKPREFTYYLGHGFEIVSWVYGNLSADTNSAISSWQGSSEHRAVILNQSIWSSLKWKAMGVGIYKNYAVVWFGEEEDPDGYW
jgi:hypothetical protein